MLAQLAAQVSNHCCVVTVTVVCQLWISHQDQYSDNNTVTAALGLLSLCCSQSKLVALLPPNSILVSHSCHDGRIHVRLRILNLPDSLLICAISTVLYNHLQVVLLLHFSRASLREKGWNQLTNSDQCPQFLRFQQT